MGFEKAYRPTVTTPVESLGSTSGKIGSWPPVTVGSATADSVVYQLPSPQSGFHKTVIIDFVGTTGDVVIANKSTATVFNGSTANIITVSSSQEHAVFDFVGISTAAYSVLWSVSPTSALPGVAFSGSTVTS